MKKFLLTFSSIVILLHGCTTESDVENKRIDSVILILLKEDISKEGRRLILECKTDSVYGCSNYFLSYNFQKNGDVIGINFTHIIVPPVCATSLGPAIANILLENLPAGNYTLQVLVNESVLQTQLIITPDYFKIEESTNSWIKILNPELKRIPENTIWGYVGFSSDSFVVKQVDPFFDSLKTYGVKELQLAEGDYNYFNIDSTGLIILKENPGTQNLKPFIYLYNNDILDLRELIKYYGRNSPLSIGLYTTKGDAFYTWQLAEEP